MIERIKDTWLRVKIFRRSAWDTLEIMMTQNWCPHPENARFARYRHIEEIAFEVEECTRCQKVFWP